MTATYLYNNKVIRGVILRDVVICMALDILVRLRENGPSRVWAKFSYTTMLTTARWCRKLKIIKFINVYTTVFTM